MTMFTLQCSRASTQGGVGPVVTTPAIRPAEIFSIKLVISVSIISANKTIITILNLFIGIQKSLHSIIRLISMISRLVNRQ